MQPGSLRRNLATLAGAVVCGVVALRADAPASAGWSFRGEVGARVSFDSNVFLQDGGAPAPGASSPGEPARAESLTGTLSAGVGIASPEFSLGRFGADYRVELVHFDDYASENHDNHRLGVSLTGARGAWRWELGGSVLFTDGSDEAPVFRRLGGGPAIGGEPVRARRDQTVGRASLRITHAGKRGWWRALANGLYQNFDTNFNPAAGCSPYVDRGESTAGIEFGREVKPGLALVAGARAGVQTQADRPPTDNLNSSNTILRVLAGVEGHATGTLKLDLRAGPDFRRFGDDLPAGMERDVVAPYGELAATWTPTAADSIVATGKYSLWLSSAGRGAYEDSAWSLVWKHRFDSRLTGRAGARLATGDSGGYAYPGAAPFRDVIYGGTLGADYRLGENSLLTLDLTHDRGESRLPDRPGREYKRLQVGLGVTRTW